MEYLEKKLDQNIKKAKEVNTYYEDHGWHILRVWAHELAEDYVGTLGRIESFIMAVKVRQAKYSLRIHT